VEDLIEPTMLIARFVRDAMEDFHCEHLTDQQMANLNPLIRKGIFEGLLLVRALESDNEEAQDAARAIAQTFKLPPDYWEPPSVDEVDPMVLAIGLA
jgi:hypothetical protein